MTKKRIMQLYFMEDKEVDCVTLLYGDKEADYVILFYGDKEADYVILFYADKESGLRNFILWR